MSEPNWDDRPEHESEEDPTEAGLTEAGDQAEAEDESADFIHDQALAQAVDQAAALVTSPSSAESATGSDEDADQDETENEGEDEAARVSAKDRALKAVGAAGVLAKTLGAKLGPVALQAGRLTARGAKAGAGLAYNYPRAAIATGLSGAILSGVLFLQPGRGEAPPTNQIKNGAEAGTTQAPGSTPDDPPANPPSVADRDKKLAKENDPAKPTDSVDPPLPEDLALNAKGNTPPASDPPPVPPVEKKNEKPAEDADLLAAADADDLLAPSPMAPLPGESLENDELPPMPPVEPVKLAGGEGQASPGLDSLAPVMDPAPAPAPAPSPTLAQTDTSKVEPPPADKPAPSPVSAAAVEGTPKSDAVAPEPVPSIEEALTHDDKLPGVDLPEPDLADLTSAEPAEKVAASSPVPPETPGDAKTPDDPGNKSAGSLAPAVSKLAKNAGIAGGLGLALGAATNAIAKAADHHDDKKAEEKPPVKPAADLPHEDIPTPTPAPAPPPVLADEPRSLDLDQNKLPNETPAPVPAPATIAGLDEEPEETPGNARINAGTAPAPLPDAGPKTAQADAEPAPRAGNETASGNPASLHDQLAREGWVPIKHAGASAPRDLQQRDIGANNEVVASEPEYRDAAGEIDQPIRFEVETQPGRNLARDAAIGATAAASGAAIAGSGDRRNASPPPEGKLETVLHRVEANENFWTISRLYYNSGRYYRALWQANKDKVPQIDKLYQDTVIRIPPPEDLDTAYIDPPGARPPVASAKPKNSKDGEARQAARTQPQAAPSGGVPIRRSSRAEAELSLPVVGLADDDEFESRGSGRQRAISNDRRSQPFDDEPEDQPRREEAPTRPIYKVRPNDTLRSIARDTLGEARRADEILDLNREIIDDPRQLIVGQILELPDDARAPRARRR